MADGSVRISCSIADHISIAFHQNSIPAVYEIAVENGLDRDLTDVAVRIATEPAFVVPTTWPIERIPAGGTHHIRTPSLKLDASLLMKLTEGVRADFTVILEVSGEQLAVQNLEVQLLPPSHWGGIDAAPELLAAFVRPNDPAVDTILHDASLKLAAVGRDNALEGYKSGRKARVWEIAEAIWAALASRGITYVLPPASFERSGQKVRSPRDIVDRKVATCLDLTLLSAACFEQAGLNPLIVVTEGHAFTGLWLKDEDFSTPIIDDVQVLRKRRDLEDIVFVETTYLTSSPPARFAAAVKHAATLVEEGAQSALEMAVDVRRARARQIRPLDLGDGKGASSAPATTETAIDIGLDGPPRFVEEMVVVEEKEEQIDRLEKWKRKLLDLTLRNKLLNFKDTKKAVEIECPDPAQLEDLLSGGQKFKLLPRTDVLGDSDQRNAGIFTETHHDDGRRRYLLDALNRNEIHTKVPDGDLDGRLTELFRITRTAFEEGGSNILFLALGFLKWTQTDGGAACRAPALLVPVALLRNSVRAGFRLALHEDETRINPTLLEMLRHDFELKMPDLEKDLPTDASGIDVTQIWRIVRTHVRDLKGWEVTNEVFLSTFSFNKYLMWKDLVDRTDLLKRNPVVRHLIDTPKQSYGDPADFPNVSRLDFDYKPVDLFTPLSADSSQLAAVLAASAGKDFVLFGPPGTGKSQTIANMIAHCLAHGKTVLFVSQKTAALEVVQRRLKQIGLGDYCLEVHSTKAQKSSVLGQLKAAWHDRSTPTADDWISATSDLQALRDDLNALVSALHRRRSNGITAYEAFGRVVAYGKRFHGIVFDWQGEVVHTADRLAVFRNICREMKTAVQATGNVSEHPLNGVKIVEWSPAWRTNVAAAIDELISRLPVLGVSFKSFSDSIGLTKISNDFATVSGIFVLGINLMKSEALVGHPFLTARRSELVAAVRELEKLQVAASQVRRGLEGSYRDGVFSLDLKQIMADWTDATNANFVVRAGRQKKVRQTLEPFAVGFLPSNIGKDLAILIDLVGLEERASSLTPAPGTFGNIWVGLNTEMKSFEPLIEWADKTREIVTLIGEITIGADSLRDHIVSALSEQPEIFDRHGRARAAFNIFEGAWNASSAAISRLGALVGQIEAGRPVATSRGWIEESISVAGRWKSNLHRAQAWSNWNAVAEKSRREGLSPLAAALERAELSPQDVERAFEIAYARWWADQVVTEDPVLRTFLAERHEDTVERFRAADERVGELSKRIVRARLGGKVPLPTAFGTDPEWGTLARELAKKARHMPLRQLFSSIPTALTRLTPCVMMSPLSIAQYLPPDASPFDVIIFDEASQIPVWDAIGAIARGRQVVIVGDPEQLPPTTVGERGVDEIDDGTDVVDQESILDECLASNIPPRRLDWHYRSRHESLIAFSNNEYYKGRLVTFPSPLTEDRAVRYVHVPNGVYERGTGKVNREEARAVVAEVVRRLKLPDFDANKHSIGIVTFNGEQQRLIENLLDQERRSYPLLEPFFDPAKWHEPVFVKNLENVQGDERDFIFFSVAVGPDQTGRVTAQVSSLNKEGGHRRLNVAVTRARRELVVFATLRPEQIDLSRTNARGVRDFKHFLEYAERGAKAIAEAFAPTGRGTESPFEDAVKEALEAKGWQVHPQVGVSDFRIDLAVVHPDAPGRYLAGVECDGATYHRSATARDRDRLREMVLTDLGWKIRRVWSTEWWMDAETAFIKLHDRLRADLEVDRLRASQAAPTEHAPTKPQAADSQPLPSAPPESVAEYESESADQDRLIEIAPQFPREEQPVAPIKRYADSAVHVPEVISVSIAEYSAADVSTCGHKPDPDQFYDPLYRPALRAMTAHVVTIEGPIFAEVLVTRIARAHGFARSGGKIWDCVLAAVERRFPKSHEDSRIVFWPAGADPDRLPPFRQSTADVRDHLDIPVVELATLARRYLGEGADLEEAVRRMTSHFGLNRLRGATRVRFEASVERARQEITHDNDN